MFDYIDIILEYDDDFYFNYVTVEFKESFSFFDYKAYKAEIEKEIN